MADYSVVCYAHAPPPGVPYQFARGLFNGQINKQFQGEFLNGLFPCLSVSMANVMMAVDHHHDRPALTEGSCFTLCIYWPFKDLPALNRITAVL